MTHLAQLLAQLNIVACSTTLAIPKGKADVALADNLHISHRHKEAGDGVWIVFYSMS